LLYADRRRSNRAFYIEGKEAEFFDSNEELFEKVSYYLEHDAERQKIAMAGHERCLKSGYSWQELMVDVVKTIEGAQFAA
jgi:spore maturation protein CgeB